jgi:hypothetical protein
MMEADLAYYVGDKRTVIDVVPQLIKVLKDLPDGKILFFHCVKGSITKEELCNFFNEVCVDVPFKLTPNELYEIGTIPYSHGINKATDSEDAVEHTYYGFELNKYEGDIKSVAKQDKTENIV